MHLVSSVMLIVAFVIYEIPKWLNALANFIKALRE